MQKHNYCGESLILAVDLEKKVLGASFTGTKTMSVGLLAFKVKSADAQIDFEDGMTYTLYHTLVYDSDLNIGLSGVNVLELRNTY